MVNGCIESPGRPLGTAGSATLLLRWTVPLNKMVDLTHVEHGCHGTLSDTLRHLHLQEDVLLYLGVEDLHDGVGAHRLLIRRLWPIGFAAREQILFWYPRNGTGIPSLSTRRHFGR